VTKKFNDGFKALEKLSVTITANVMQEASLQIKENECCGKTTGVSKKSSAKMAGNFGSLSIEGRIWPPPGPPFVDWASGPVNIGVASVEIKAKLNGGVFIGGTASIAGELGYRKDGCSDDAADRSGCIFAGLDTSITPSITAKIAGSGSFSVDCILGCEKTTFKASASFSGGASWPIHISKVTYNQPKCSSGLDGGLMTFDPVGFKVNGKFSVGYDIDGSSSTFEYSQDFLSCTVSFSEAKCAY